MARLRGRDVDAAAVIAAMPAELWATDECVCARCRPDLDRAEAERLLAHWAAQRRSKIEWLRTRGVGPLEYLQYRADVREGRITPDDLAAALGGLAAPPTSRMG